LLTFLVAVAMFVSAVASRFGRNREKSPLNASRRTLVRWPPTTGYAEKCTARWEIANAASEPRWPSAVTRWPVAGRGNKQAQ